MPQLETRAAELRAVIQDVVHQFRVVDSVAINGPHSDLTLQELRLLEHIGDAGPRMMRELAEFLLLAVNSVTSVVDGLEGKKLVERLRSSSDRRVVQVDLTERGRIAWESVRKEKLGFCCKLLSALDDHDRTTFVCLLRKVAQAGKDRLEELGC